MTKKKRRQWKEILVIAWPLIVANSFWNIQLTVDRMFLGASSTEALGAAMAVMGVFWTPMALLQQTSAYVTTFIAQYLGAKEEDKIGEALWHSIYVSVVGGVLFLGLIYFSEDLFGLMGHSKNLQALESSYFNALCFSALPTALVAALSGYFTGLGDTKTVMAINFVGVLVNVVFDYFLIFGNWGFPALGIVGAGYATSLAGYGSALFAFYLVLKSKNKVRHKIWQGLQWNIDLLKRFLKFGVPSGLQWALEGLAFTVFLAFIGRFPNGDAAMAASSVAVTVMFLSILPTMGIAQAVMVLMGQYLGEKSPEKARLATWNGVQISALYMLAIGLTFVAIPDFYISWFENKSDLALWSQVEEITPYLLVFVAIFTLFDSMNLNFSFALKGAGDTRFVSIISLTVPWIFMVIPTVYLNHDDSSVYWAWGYATIFGIVTSSILCLRFVQGKWRGMSVIH